MAKHLPTDEICRLYTVEKMSMEAIAQLYHCSDFLIRKILITKGVHTPRTNLQHNLNAKQRNLLLEIFDVCNEHFLRPVRLYKINLQKLYELVTTKDAPFVVRKDFYETIKEESLADLWWEIFCDWWFKKYDNYKQND